MKGIKRERYIESLKNSINSFLGCNSDNLGFCHVEQIVLSNDFKRAKIYILFIEDNDIKDKISFLNKSRKDILNEYNKRYSSKFYPSIKFYSFNDEFSI